MLVRSNKRHAPNYLTHVRASTPSPTDGEGIPSLRDGGVWVP